MGVERGVVLLVSNDAAANLQVTRSLEAKSFVVKTVPSFESCLAEVANNLPAAVLVSLFGDHLDVPLLLKKLHEYQYDLPVIVMADAATVPQVVPLLDQGASDYLVFPVIHPSLIVYAVTRSQQTRRAERKRRRSERELKRLNKALVESLNTLEQDQQAGFRVQRGMMPESPYVSDRLTFRHLIVPSLILSGDFIDYFELPDRRLLFYIADVSGHGAPGAIVTVLLKSLSSRLYNEFEELGVKDADDILEWFNRELLACHLEQHVAMFLGVIDQAGRQLHYANAAHFPATILSCPGKTEYLAMGGLPLGIYSTAKYTRREVALPEAFTMVMFSDGVFDVLPEGSVKAKEEHLLSLVKADAGDIDSMANHLGLGSLKDVPDDIAVFTLARAG
ncbi:MAG: PP2C family protein-serine/threonine phosphatase [Pseudomonadota bacterium]